MTSPAPSKSGDTASFSRRFELFLIRLALAVTAFACVTVVIELPSAGLEMLFDMHSTVGVGGALLFASRWSLKSNRIRVFFALLIVSMMHSLSTMAAWSILLSVDLLDWAPERAGSFRTIAAVLVYWSIFNFVCVGLLALVRLTKSKSPADGVNHG